MLYIDLNDRRGNEGRFIATMDSVGATIGKEMGVNTWAAFAGADGNGSITARNPRA